MIAKATATKKRLPRHPLGGELAWKMAYLFPAQGSWRSAEYFNLLKILEGRPRVELVNGRLEVLPMPMEPHDFIMVFFFKLLEAFTSLHFPGIVFPNCVKIRVKRSKKRNYRIPDVAYLKKENYHLRRKNFWDGADLVMEVVSGNPADRQRDLTEKVEEYAAAGIAEYWIIDPESQSIRVLTLVGKTYQLHGEFRLGQLATSVLLPGFTVSVDEALASALGPQ